MALSPQLLQFKSSGVYRLEFDKSQTVNIPSETIRLIVGRSKKGPYNTPVLIENTEQFIQIFGGIDNSLEKRGMFFHRSALEALSRGPILALNLTTKDENDEIFGVSPVTAGGIQGLNSASFDGQFSDAFDTGKFWVPEDAKVLAMAGNTTPSSSNAISFVNIKQDPITIIVKQASNTDGFNLTAREWYGEGEVPEGIEELEYVSDYMVDVFVFKGKFNSADLNNDPTFGPLFTGDGLKKESLAAFTSLREVEVLAQYTGSLIPDFRDNEGRQLYIQTIINNEARRTGLFCAINEDAIGAIDLIGEDFNIYQDYQLLSHIVDQKVTTKSFEINKVIKVESGQLVIEDADLLDIEAEIGDWLYSQISGEFTQIANIFQSGNDVIITTEDTGILGIPKKSTYESFEEDGDAATFDPSAISINQNNQLVITDLGGVNFNANGLSDGSFLMSENQSEFVEIATIDTSNPNEIVITPAGDGKFSQSYINNNATSLQGFSRTETTTFLYANLVENERATLFPTDWTFTAKGAGVFTLSKTVASSEDEPIFNPKYHPNVNTDIMNIKVGMYVPTNSNQGKLARVKQIKKLTPVENTVTNETTYSYEFVCHRDIQTKPLYALKSYEEATQVYKMFPLAGATQSEKTIASLLSMLRPGNGLSNTLIDKDAIDFRYVVDTFGSLEAGTLLNKEEIAQLCKERQNASGILNAPMVKELKASENPSFIDEFTGEFNTRFVKTGGNINLNPTALYSLPSVNDGATYVFYYGPGLNVLENGRTKVIPPAAYVSNNYIDKFSDALPWSIVAGPRRGVISGTGVQGVEYPFDKNDRDVLEPFGYNPIVFERGVGVVIKGNKTAQQSIQSALSSAHVREAMIFIEDGLAAILQNYLFEFNNAQTRLEIQTLADNFMESVKKDGGVFDYRNIMDTSNNTNEVIDNNIGILDTFVEPVKGLEILVSRVTILNTGEIATGNFA